MKKIFLILFVICIVNKAEALVIQNVTITNNNAADINIKVNVADGYVLEFYSSNYTIDESIIVLNIYYVPFLLPTNTFLENNFVIADISAATNNYTLLVNCYKRRNISNVWSCTSILGSATETITFSTLLLNPVSLANTVFEQRDKISIFPNPTSTTFQIQYQNIKEIKPI